MARVDKKAFEPLDLEEKELMASLDGDDWQVVPDVEKEKKRFMLLLEIL